MNHNQKLTDAAIKKCLSFGNVSRKASIRMGVAVSGGLLAVAGFLGMMGHCAYLIFGSLLGFQVSVRTTFEECSVYVLATGMAVFFMTAFMRNYEPIESLPVNRFDHLKCLERYLRDVPEVRHLRDAILASGRQLCCRDYDVIQELANGISRHEREREEPQRRAVRTNLAAQLNQTTPK